MPQNMLMRVVDPGEPPDAAPRHPDGLPFLAGTPAGYCGVRLDVDTVCALPLGVHQGGAHRAGDGTRYVETEEILHTIGSSQPWEPFPIHDCTIVVQGPITLGGQPDLGVAVPPGGTPRVDIGDILEAQARQQLPRGDGGVVATVWVHTDVGPEPWPLVGYLDVHRGAGHTIDADRRPAVLVGGRDLDTVLWAKPWARLTIHLEPVRVAVRTTVIRLAQPVQSGGTRYEPGSVVRVRVRDAEAMDRSGYVARTPTPAKPGPPPPCTHDYEVISAGGTHHPTGVHCRRCQRHWSITTT